VKPVSDHSVAINRQQAEAHTIWL